MSLALFIENESHLFLLRGLSYMLFEGILTKGNGFES